MREPTSYFPIFSSAERRFISNNAEADVSQLAMQLVSKPDFDKLKVLHQISARQKIRTKLPEWHANPNLVFPRTISLEQASSSATARYKAGLLRGESLIDITTGMGVDAFYIGQNFKRVRCFERQIDLAAVTRWNLEQLAPGHFEVTPEDGIEAVNRERPNADWIYADPARRDGSNQKTVLLSDSEPDIVACQALLLQTAPRILIKTSPLLDIRASLGLLQNVREVHVLSIDRDCKEVCYLLDREFAGQQPEIYAVHLNASGNVNSGIRFSFDQEAAASPGYSEPLRYLYEPHPAVLKAGAFKILTGRYPVFKLATHSHLYTSSAFVADFPGRAFEVLGVADADRKAIGKYISSDRINLAIRNFPGKPADLLKKWRLKEGGHDYLFATTLQSGKKVVLICAKAGASELL